MDEIKATLITYLTTIRAGGVDLAEYGLQEQKLYRDVDIDKEFLVSSSYRNRLRRFVVRLIGFTYGPTPEDWKVWFSEPTDIYVGEFWHGIENPWEHISGAWEHIPGAWVENDSGYDSK